MQKSFERIGTLSIEHVIPLVSKFIESGRNPSSARNMLLGYSVKTSETRLECFATKGTRCTACGLEGKYFALERIRGRTDNPHLNLYATGVGGTEILMTRDHILARALGGKDILDNCQTYCQPCNYLKSIGEGEACIALMRTRASQPPQK